MARRPTLVRLECPSLGICRDFTVAHAERLLRLRDGGGWRLPEVSNFTFDKENGIKRG